MCLRLCLVRNLYSGTCLLCRLPSRPRYYDESEIEQMARYFIGNHIAINSFKDSPNIERYVHFITHVSNSLTSVPLNLFERIGQVYTSAFFAWYMITFFGVEKNVLVPVNFGEELTVYKDGQEVTFVFIKNTSVEPNFMILFKKDTGDELFAGSCRFTEAILTSETLRRYTISQLLTKIYFDGSYINCPRIPSSTSVLRSVIATIRANRRKVVYISANRLGNELVLRTIARALNKKIYVSPEKFLVLEKLGISNCFTTDLSTTYIRTMDYSQISVQKQISRNTLVGRSVAIVLSVRVFLHEQKRQEELTRANIHVFPVTALETPSTLPAIKQILADKLVVTNISSVPSNTVSTSCEYCTSSLPLLSEICRQKIHQKCRLDKTAVFELEKISPQYYFKWRGANKK